MTVKQTKSYIYSFYNQRHDISLDRIYSLIYEDIFGFYFIHMIREIICSFFYCFE